MSDAPHYAEFAPRESLAEFVHCVWTFASPFADPEPQRIAPDGRTELIVHCGAPYVERRAEGEHLQPRVLFAGQLTAPLTLVATGVTTVVGVRFRPEAARAFLGRDADEATDRRLDLAQVHGASALRLRDEARDAASLCSTVGLAQDYVEARVRGVLIDADVRSAVTALLAEEELVAPAEVSERQWQRRFKAEVGVSPRMLQSVLRFRRVFDAIEHPENPDWVEAALAAGYFDQPQMARDFRRFLGCTAREWAAQKAGLAQALVSETYKS